MMAFRLLQHTLTAAILASTALAQAPNIIPTDLTGGFSSEEVQVSFSASAVDGFASGTTFEKADVALEPTFALGDSNGISPTTLYTLVMLDTTCPNARKLHYVRSNFKFAFAGGTNIETESAPLLDYQAPGAFNEQGDDRQYVFLMYVNPQRSEFTQMQLPARGAVFDVERFQSDNGLDDAIAGVGMVVRLGGTADCGSEGGSEVPAESSPAASSSAVPVSSTSATTPGATASSATSSTLSVTSAPVPTQTSGLQASPTPVPPNGEEEDSSDSGSEGGDEEGEDEEGEEEDESPPTPPTALPPTPRSTRTTTILRTDGAASPTSLSPDAAPSTVGATGTASPTSSGNSVPQQTANAAAAGGGVSGRAVVVVGLFGIALGFLW